MNRGPLRQALASIQLVLLLVMQLAEGTGLHHCPEHDAGAGITPVQPVAHAAMMGHMGHHPTGEDAGPHACQCMGTCCAASLVLQGPEVPVLPVSLLPHVPPSSRATLSLRDSVRLLPFAIGPPSVT